jgi:hypothetical protein
MKLRYIASCGCACAALALAGCDSGRQAPGKVAVRVAHVAPGFAELQFRREQTSPATLAFKGAQEVSYDADTYDFYVEERSLDGTTPGRTWTFARQLTENNAYTIVLTELGGEVSPVVLEYPTVGANDAQIVALHAAPGAPALDLYLERPGVGLAGATPRGTFSLQEQIAPRTLPSGEYEIYLTPAGNPSSLVLASASVTLPSGGTSTLIVTPEAGEGTAPLSVLLLSAAPATIYDRNATAELRVINAANDGAPRDVALNGQFSPPAFAAVPYGGVPTAYTAIPVASAQPLQVTPAGNPGVLEIDQALSTVLAQRSTMLFTGDPGALTSVVVADDRRRLNNEAKLRLYNAASQFVTTFMDFVIVPTGADPNLYAPLSVLVPPGASPILPLVPGSYELYLRQTSTTTYMSGPTPITISAGGIYGIIALNGPDTATATVVLFDDFQ